jgi:uncharacterized protein (UPF0262 family)
MTANPGRIASITLDEGSIIKRAPPVEHERSVAISDLLEDNVFSPAGLASGPYHVHLAVKENRLIFDISSAGGEHLSEVALSIQSLRSIIRDYFMICESYYDALKGGGPGKIEAIDMGRRGMHNEGSEMLQQLLREKITVDFCTARRLFTLICVLHIK